MVRLAGSAGVVTWTGRLAEPEWDRGGGAGGKGPTCWAVL